MTYVKRFHRLPAAAMPSESTVVFGLRIHELRSGNRKSMPVSSGIRHDIDVDLTPVQLPSSRVEPSNHAFNNSTSTDTADILIACTGISLNSEESGGKEKMEERMEANDSIDDENLVAEQTGSEALATSSTGALVRASPSPSPSASPSSSLSHSLPLSASTEPRRVSHVWRIAGQRWFAARIIAPRTATVGNRRTVVRREPWLWEIKGSTSSGDDWGGAVDELAKFRELGIEHNHVGSSWEEVLRIESTNDKLKHRCYQQSGLRYSLSFVSDDQVLG
ncbi:hypothetical protein MBM_02221 [Drepanopeziza brunnea f. sp. 'multigermtubi' MB_m1]|uniref:Uncharacterized protein n=1 Tax=Marssonina brunnea f. sp. multigermtubi (strain MB_m1) TaxID=1072389 RepID=K1Y1G5_MARBU|nr:uncharacterized protein MBM_02221 [Drepanopeziza brunnea f. sp. 'multigermtubi' MB_m1]EKD18984.1 hypothetical protein MBM_02221 [Drepanopeziza brunnea f. sp. 'multigermtubi' MB_m1]